MPWNFNPRPHAGDDHLGVQLDLHLNDFNPRPHAGDDSREEVVKGAERYFNPRPHAGDDRTGSGPAFPTSISTHVPTRGTTPTTVTVDPSERIFQPTSPRGGRQHKSPKTAQLFIRLSHIFSSLCQTNHKEPYSPVPLCTPVPSIMKFSRCEGTVQIM